MFLEPLKAIFLIDELLDEILHLAEAVLAHA